MVPYVSWVKGALYNAVATAILTFQKHRVDFPPYYGHSHLPLSQQTTWTNQTPNQYKRHHILITVLPSNPKSAY